MTAIPLGEENAAFVPTPSVRDWLPLPINVLTFPHPSPTAPISGAASNNINNRVSNMRVIYMICVNIRCTCSFKIRTRPARKRPSCKR